MTSLLAGLEPDFTPQDQAVLLAAMQAVEVAAGADPLEGIEGPTLGVVASGEIAALLPTGRGDLELREMSTGELFGETEFLDRGSPLVRLEARTASVVHVIPRSTYEAGVLKEHPGVASRLALALGRRLAARVRATSVVRFENIDDDPEVEVVSGMAALLSPDARPKAPFRCMSSAAHAGLGVEQKDLTQRQREAELAARMLKPLGHELYHGIGERMAIRTLEDGACVVSQGETPDGLYLLLDGEVDVEVGGGDGTRMAATLESGSVFGQISFLLELPRSATCRVRNRATLGIVGGHLVQGLIRYAREGRPAGMVGLEWIAGQCATDLRRTAAALAKAYEENA